ncbi:response regulator transcription factor [uncultured Microbulbifer sp.]|uniref:response regulator transcription factor n=1 Tax=uncultured Microbulbifer sp. TaxID=348147 RepID=UPI0025E4B50D|nr:response regulator transcription factor [uncultured Microbulbifer sp.]
MRGKRILLVEQDLRLAQSVIDALRELGVVLWHLNDGGNLERVLRYGEFDLVLTDFTADPAQGIEIIQQIRRNFSGPCLVLSSLHDVSSQLQAFELGVDDFISESEDPRLLLARIRANLRHYEGHDYKGVRNNKKNKIKLDNLTIDWDDQFVLVGDRPFALSTGELELLWMLATHPQQALSREFLFINTLGRPYDGLDRTIDRRVSRLRKKMDSHTNLALTVRTIWGKGYMLAGM